LSVIIKSNPTSKSFFISVDFATFIFSSIDFEVFIIKSQDKTSNQSKSQSIKVSSFTTISQIALFLVLNL
jgi:hypothetical protein